MTLGTVLLVILVLALLGVIPGWPHSRRWGYTPSGLENLAMKQFKYISTFIIAIMLTSVLACAETPKRQSTGGYVDDTVITTKVKAAIFNDHSLKSAEINVETFKGTVQLSGFVRSRANIDRAVEVAKGVNGVKSVENDMRLK